MTLGILIEQTRDSVDDLDAAIVAMLARIDEISRLSGLEEREFVELSAIFNNIAYMLLYLESNASHVSVDFIDCHRTALTDATERDGRLLGLLERLSCHDNECEAARLAFVAHLSENLERRESQPDEVLKDLVGEARDILDRLRRDQAIFLDRLGLRAGDRRPTLVFYGLLTRTASDATRQKMSLVWQQIGGQHHAALSSVVDRIVDQRRRHSETRGSSVLARTLTRCRVGEAECRSYWEEVLTLAVTKHVELEAEIEESLGAKGGVKANFGRYVGALQADRAIPPIPLAACIETMAAVVQKLFGLAIRRIVDVPPHMTTFDILRDGDVIGRINFDLWDVGPARRQANMTIGVRNRTEWRGIVQKPVAHVSCRFRRSQDNKEYITFQNAHSLFHEFGHAMNHLLVTRRVPNISGLEFLPLERLEILSMWFERFVYHPVFESFLGFVNAELEGLEVSRQIKMLEYRRTHLERAVICALDFEMHAAAAIDIRSCYEMIDARFGISKHCALGDVLEYFVWPMLLANPGAYFSYLWGAGASAERFAPYMHRDLDDMPGPQETFELFRDSFSFDAQSIRPNPKAVFDFYDVPCVR